jgi:hypothetical protein
MKKSTIYYLALLAIGFASGAFFSYEFGLLSFNWFRAFLLFLGTVFFSMKYVRKTMEEKWQQSH